MQVTGTVAFGRTRQEVNYSMHARIRAGDPEAFRELFRDYAQLVYRHAVRSTGDWAAAEDVVSLTFLEAWRLREKLRDEGESPRPWLMGIAVNVLRNTGRAARRHERALARVPVRDALPDFADELVGRIADSEELGRGQVRVGAAAAVGARGVRAVRVVRPRIRGGGRGVGGACRDGPVEAVAGQDPTAQAHRGRFAARAKKFGTAYEERTSAG
jgi:RNA polymerase sigma factor (sigma-70 family)